MKKNKELENISTTQLTIIRDELIKLYDENPIRTTDELKDICRSRGLFKPDMYATAGNAAETAIINAANGSIKDADGNRAIHSVTLPNPITGKSDRTNYRESLFDLSLYQSFIPKVGNEALNKFKKVKGLVENCLRKFKVDVGEQLSFDFQLACEAFGLKEKQNAKSKTKRARKNFLSAN